MRHSCLLLSVLSTVLMSVLAPVQALSSVTENQYRLQDISGELSPVRVSGHVVFRDDSSTPTRYSYAVSASAANTSRRDVLLIVIRFRLRDGENAPGLNQAYKCDYFFSTATFKPGSTDPVHLPVISFGKPRTSGDARAEDDLDAREIPTATAKVEFVQFADGSTWGDAEPAKDALDERLATLSQLDELERIYREQGEQEFTAAISKSTLPPIRDMQNTCSDKKAQSACLLDSVRRMNAAARHHEAAMNGVAKI